MPTISGFDQPLPATLSQRIFPRNDFLWKQKDPSFVLYLPTVNLRFQHNPAFAWACRLANDAQVPLLVLAVVLDDAHLPKPDNTNPNNNVQPIVFTARRIAFVLEVLQY